MNESNHQDTLTQEALESVLISVLTPLVRRLEALEVSHNNLCQSQENLLLKLAQQQEKLVKELTTLLNSKKSTKLQELLSDLNGNLQAVSQKLEEQRASEQQLNNSMKRLEQILRSKQDGNC